MRASISLATRTVPPTPAPRWICPSLSWPPMTRMIASLAAMKSETLKYGLVFSLTVT